MKSLLEAGAIFQQRDEDARHPEAQSAHGELVRLDDRLGHPPATQKLLSLYRLFQGPIAMTLDNRREPFLPVAPQVKGRNVYPAASHVRRSRHS